MNFVKKKIKEFSSQVCLVNKDKSKIFYKSLFQNISKRLETLEKKSVILTLAENNSTFIKSYFYFLGKGIVQIIVNFNINKKFLYNIINLYKPNYIFVNKNYEFIDDKYKLYNQIGDFELFRQKKYKKIKLDENLAILLTTSGSTGSSKFVKLSYTNILDNTKNIIKYLDIKKNHRTITTMPPSYSYALSILNTHFYSGASIVINNFSILERNFWNIIKELKVNSFGGVPYHYEILKKIKFDKIILPDLKYITQAGGPLNKEITKYFLKTCIDKKIDFITMYGQTEASPRISYLPFKIAFKKIGSIGKAIPGGKIVLKKNKKSDDIGEIVYYGKNVFIGYSKSYKDLTKSKKKIKALFTGDLGKKDKDGFFYITGRKNRIIKIAGHRINLDELRDIVKNKGYDCHFLEKNQKIVAFIKEENTNNELLTTISSEIKLSKNLFDLKKIKEFPLNERGKIDYLKLQVIK